MYYKYYFSLFLGYTFKLIILLLCWFKGIILYNLYLVVNLNFLVYQDFLYYILLAVFSGLIWKKEWSCWYQLVKFFLLIICGHMEDLFSSIWLNTYRISILQNYDAYSQFSLVWLISFSTLTVRSYWFVAFCPNKNLLYFNVSEFQVKVIILPDISHCIFNLLIHMSWTVCEDWWKIIIFPVYLDSHY